jgi:hypothetical protein
MPKKKKKKKKKESKGREINFFLVGFAITGSIVLREWSQFVNSLFIVTLFY